jgi:metal-responsive CopG/Arc/MetJ family transcriptional regulator
MSHKNGTESVSVSLDGQIIQLMDSAAGHLDLNRSKFVEKAIKAYILSNAEILSGDGSSTFWDKVYQYHYSKS